MSPADLEVPAVALSRLPLFPAANANTIERVNINPFLVRPDGALALNAFPVTLSPSPSPNLHPSTTIVPQFPSPVSTRTPQSSEVAASRYPEVRRQSARIIVRSVFGSIPRLSTKPPVQHPPETSPRILYMNSTSILSQEGKT